MSTLDNRFWVEGKPSRVLTTEERDDLMNQISSLLDGEGLTEEQKSELEKYFELLREYIHVTDPKAKDLSLVRKLGQFFGNPVLNGRVQKIQAIVEELIKLV